MDWREDEEWEPREPSHAVIGTDAWEERGDSLVLPAGTTLEDDEQEEDAGD